MVWDRRRFLVGAGVVAVGGVGAAFASDSEGYTWSRKLAYLAAEDCVEVLRGERLLQRISCVGVTGLVVADDRRWVYAGSAVEGFKGRPSGAVEAFEVLEDGRLRTAGRVGLALFSFRPEGLAVSPGGRWLAIGLAAGGINLLRLAEDGRPGRVVSCVRPIGAVSGGDVRFSGDRSLMRGGRTWSVGEDGALGSA